MATMKKVPVFCVISSSTGHTEEIRFVDGSYTYMTETLKQAFREIKIYNVGSGDVRFSFTDGLDISTAVDGSKTLKSGTSINLEMDVSYIAIYFIASSQVELILLPEDDDE
jgi:hypothetical protein